MDFASLLHLLYCWHKLRIPCVGHEFKNDISGVLQDCDARARTTQKMAGSNLGSNVPQDAPLTILFVDKNGNHCAAWKILLDDVSQECSFLSTEAPTSPGSISGSPVHFYHWAAINYRPIIDGSWICVHLWGTEPHRQSTIRTHHSLMGSEHVVGRDDRGGKRSLCTRVWGMPIR